MLTQVTLPLNATNTHYQWAVQDRRTGKIVRTAETRTAARNKSRMSKHYKVVRRPITVGEWTA